MSEQLGMVLSAAVPMCVVAYAAFNFGTNLSEANPLQKYHGLMRAFYWGVAQLLGIVTVFIGSRVAAASSSSTLVNMRWALNGTYKALIFVFMVYVFYLIIMFVKNSVEAAAGEPEDFKPGQ